MLLFAQFCSLQFNKSKARKESYVSCPENESVTAIVTGFSKSRQIVFASCEHYGTITFHLGLDVWSSGTAPQLREVVVLSGLSRSEKGWRAKKARPFKLTDEVN
jgi:hypothetical protein